MDTIISIFLDSPAPLPYSPIRRNANIRYPLSLIAYVIYGYALMLCPISAHCTTQIYPGFCIWREKYRHIVNKIAIKQKNVTQVYGGKHKLVGHEYAICKTKGGQVILGLPKIITVFYLFSKNFSKNKKRPFTNFINKYIIS